MGNDGMGTWDEARRRISIKSDSGSSRSQPIWPHKTQQLSAYPRLRGNGAVPVTHPPLLLVVLLSELASTAVVSISIQGMSPAPRAVPPPLPRSPHHPHCLPFRASITRLPVPSPSPRPSPTSLPTAPCGR